MSWVHQTQTIGSDPRHLTYMSYSGIFVAMTCYRYSQKEASLCAVSQG
jgi:hypothetical protein